jgi:hypothetical protein
MDPKAFYYSKTLWVNLIAMAAMGLQSYYGQVVLDPTAQVAILGFINVALRIVTKTPVAWSADNKGHARLSVLALLSALMLTVALLVSGGCAGTNANKAVTAAEITNASINSTAAALEDLCKSGTIKPADCQKIQVVYDRLKTADDSAIHIMAACIQAGQDPKSSPDYNAATAEAAAAAADLFKLATDLGVIKGGVK